MSGFFLSFFLLVHIPFLHLPWAVALFMHLCLCYVCTAVVKHKQNLGFNFSFVFFTQLLESGVCVRARVCVHVCVCVVVRRVFLAAAPFEKGVQSALPSSSARKAFSPRNVCMCVRGREWLRVCLLCVSIFPRMLCHGPPYLCPVLGPHVQWLSYWIFA